MGYSIDGGFGEYAVALRPLRRAGAGRRRPVRRGPAAPAPASRRTRRSRSRARARPTSSRSSASAASATWRSSTPRSPAAGSIAVDLHRREARARTRARRRVHGERREGGPGRGDPAPRRRRPGDRAGGLADAVRAGVRIAAPGRHARLRRAARRQRDDRSRSSRPCSTGSRSSARSSALDPSLGFSTPRAARRGPSGRKRDAQEDFANYTKIQGPRSRPADTASSPARRELTAYPCQALRCLAPGSRRYGRRSPPIRTAPSEPSRSRAAAPTNQDETSRVDLRLAMLDPSCL